MQRPHILALVGWSLLGLLLLPYALFPVLICVYCIRLRQFPEPWMYTLIFTGAPVGLAAFAHTLIKWRAWLEYEPSARLVAFRVRMCRSLVLSAAVGAVTYAVQEGDPRMYVTAVVLVCAYVFMCVSAIKGKREASES